MLPDPGLFPLPLVVPPIVDECSMQVVKKGLNLSEDATLPSADEAKIRKQIVEETFERLQNEMEANSRVVMKYENMILKMAGMFLMYLCCIIGYLTNGDYYMLIRGTWTLKFACTLYGT